MSTEELKQFILWAKSVKLKRFKNEECEFELSDLAYIDDLTQPTNKEMFLGSSKTLVDTEKPNQKEEEEDLFWSTNL